MALLPGSPAIDAGSNAIAGLPCHRPARCPARTGRPQRRNHRRYRRLRGQLVVPGHQHRRLDDVGTLRAAIGWANVSTNANPANIANPAPNTIVFDTAGAFATPQTITLSQSLGAGYGPRPAQQRPTIAARRRA